MCIQYIQSIDRVVYGQSIYKQLQNLSSVHSVSSLGDTNRFVYVEMEIEIEVCGKEMVGPGLMLITC